MSQSQTFENLIIELKAKIKSLQDEIQSLEQKIQELDTQYQKDTSEENLQRIAEEKIKNKDFDENKKGKNYFEVNEKLLSELVENIEQQTIEYIENKLAI